ncbi:MAG: RNA methyltransferase [Thermoplasmata archaeon]
MPEIDIVLVEPKTPGNVGAVARLIKNFGLKDLVLINPVTIDGDAMIRAMHAKDVLENADIKDDLKAAVSRYDMVVGTSGVDTDKEKRFLRQADAPERFAEDVMEYQGKIALLFGREDIGLLNDEISLCDRFVRIPTSEGYPIMNLSHAVGIVLYELFKNGVETSSHGEQIDESDRERLMDTFEEIMDVVDYPEHKKRRTLIMFRRILGKANTTSWEYHRLMGVFRYISDKLGK